MQVRLWWILLRFSEKNSPFCRSDENPVLAVDATDLHPKMQEGVALTLLPTPNPTLPPDWLTRHHSMGEGASQEEEYPVSLKASLPPYAAYSAFQRALNDIATNGLQPVKRDRLAGFSTGYSKIVAHALEHLGFLAVRQLIDKCISTPV